MKGLIKSVLLIGCGLALGGVVTLLSGDFISMQAKNDLRRYNDKLPSSIYLKTAEELYKRYEKGQLTEEQLSAKETKTAMVEEYFKNDADYKALKKKVEDTEKVGIAGDALLIGGGVAGLTGLALDAYNKEHESKEE